MTHSTVSTYNPLKRLKTAKTKQSSKKSKKSIRKKSQPIENIGHEAHRRLPSVVLESLAKNMTSKDTSKPADIKYLHHRKNLSQVSNYTPMLAAQNVSCFIRPLASKNPGLTQVGQKTEKQMTNSSFFFKKRRDITILSLLERKGSPQPLKPRLTSPKIISRCQLDKLSNLLKIRNSTKKEYLPDRSESPKPPIEPLIENNPVFEVISAPAKQKVVMGSTCDANYDIDSDDDKPIVLVHQFRSHELASHSSDSSERFPCYQDNHMPNTKYTEVSYLADQSNLNVESPTASLFKDTHFLFDRTQH